MSVKVRLVASICVVLAVMLGGLVTVVVLLTTAQDVNTEQLLAFNKILVTSGALAQLAGRTTKE